MRLTRKRNPDTASTEQSKPDTTPTGRTRSRRELLAEAGGAVVKYGSAAVIGNMIGNMDDFENEEAAKEAARQAGATGYRNGYDQATREGQVATAEAVSLAVLERRGVDQVAADRLVDYTFAAMGDRNTGVVATRFNGEIVLRGTKGTTRIPGPLALVAPGTAESLTDPREVPMSYQVTNSQNQVMIKGLIGEVEGVEFQPYDPSDPHPFEEGILYGDIADVDPNDPVGGGKGRRVAVFETPTGKLVQPGVPVVDPTRSV